MDTFTFDLDFLCDHENQIPGKARIYVKSAEVGATLWGTEIQATFVTPECVSAREFREQGERLKSEIDKIVKNAERKFQKARAERTAARTGH